MVLHLRPHLHRLLQLQLHLPLLQLQRPLLESLPGRVPLHTFGQRHEENDEIRMPACNAMRIIAGSVE
jgi:hypothetical protein